MVEVFEKTFTHLEKKKKIQKISFIYQKYKYH